MIISALVSTKGQAEAVLKSEARRIYLESAFFGDAEWENWTARIHKAGKEAYLALPAVFRVKAESYFIERLNALKKAGFDGFLLRNTESLLFLREEGFSCEFTADHGVYVWNSESKKMMDSFGFSGYTCPVELSKTDLAAFGVRDMEIIAYGYLPAMVTANCIRKTLSVCDRKNGISVLKDRDGRLMTVQCACRFCQNVIYNSVPLFLYDRILEISSLGIASLRLSFTTETEDEAVRLIRAFADALRDPVPKELSLPRFTRAGFDKSAE